MLANNNAGTATECRGSIKRSQSTYYPALHQRLACAMLY